MVRFKIDQRQLKGLNRILRVGLLGVWVLCGSGCNANENNAKTRNYKPNTCKAVLNPQQAKALQDLNRANEKSNRMCYLAEVAQDYYEKFTLTQYQKAIENTKEYQAYQTAKQAYENTK